MAEKIGFKKIIQWWEKVKSTRYRLGEHLDRDWLILFWCFVLISISFVFVTVYLFSSLDMNGLGMDENESGNSAPLINEKVLQDTSAYYEKKVFDLENLLNNPPRVSDPSK